MSRKKVVTKSVSEGVLECLANGGTQRDAARKYKISTASVNLIANGKYDLRKPKPICPVTGWTFNYEAW